MPKPPGGASADRQTDPGPNGLRQGRLRGAGWVRHVENPTPLLDLPPQGRKRERPPKPEHQTTPREDQTP